MRLSITILMLVAVAFAGCADSGDEAEPTGTTSTPPPADDGANETAPPEPEPFEPQTHEWDGTSSADACAAGSSGGGCAGPDDPTGGESHKAFEIPEGATKASFEVTWDDPRSLEVNVYGEPLKDSTSATGASPITFEAPLDSAGEINVFVNDVTTTQGGDTGIKTTVQFHLTLVVS